MSSDLVRTGSLLETKVFFLKVTSLFPNCLFMLCPRDRKEILHQPLNK